MSGNIIEDETLLIFNENLDKNLKIEEISFSSCKLGDFGVLSLLSGINKNRNYIKLNLKDNFISEKCENKIVDLWENSNLIKLSLEGNRITPSVLKKINIICKKNLFNLKNKEPLRLKRKINRMNFEKKKIKNWENETKEIKNNIQTIEEKKASLELELNSFKEDFIKRKEKIEEQINQDIQTRKDKELELSILIEKIEKMNKIYEKQYNYHKSELNKVLEYERNLINKKQDLELKKKNKINNFDVKRIKYNQEIYKLNEIISELIEEENIMKTKIKQLNDKTYIKSLKDN